MKIAVLAICLNEKYWPYIGPMIESARKHFLPGHEVDFLLWTDMTETTYGATIFPTEPVEWPLPTLMRYHLFLQQEEKLREYDYLFYVDADMLFVDTVGDEIFGEGITGAIHPMHNRHPKFQYAPLEPNPHSAAYVNREEFWAADPSRFYYAGGFQGGRTEEFIVAMKSMKSSVDRDFIGNYVAIWNDESHWNRYLWDNPPVITLSPAYVYPDSLISEYYENIWGTSYQPKLVTLTKKFTTTSEGGAAIREMLQELS